MTPEEYKRITGREPDEDELEALAWLTTLSEETGAGVEAGDVRDILENQNTEGGWDPRSDADSEGQKAKYVQQYALRGATGGDRGEGGYSTELVDDPERQWTRGVAAQAGDPGEEGSPGVESVPWVKPTTPRPTSSSNVRERIIQMYEQFHLRTPSEDEVDDWFEGLNYPGWYGTREPKPGWEKTLFDGIVGSPEYQKNAEGRLNDLYLKYYGREVEDDEIYSNLRHPQGLLGVEWTLAQNPGEAYKASVDPYEPEVVGRDPRDAKEAVVASWDRGVPTMGDIWNPRPVPDPDPDPDPDPVTTVDTDPPGTAQPTIAPPKAPYSARPVTQPYTVDPRAGSSRMPWAPNPYTAQQVYPPGMPSVSPYQGTVGSTVSAPTSPTVASGGDPASWNNFNGYYGRASQDYAAGPQGAGYNPAPWANIDNRLMGGPRGRPGLAGMSDESAEDRRARRAYEFGRRERVGNQSNADLGNQDFRSQMDRWIRSYNQWNQQGVDPFAPPVGGRRAITGTGSSNNTGGS